MVKTQEELNQLKVEYETLNNKLKELTENELKQVTGGLIPIIFASDPDLMDSKVGYDSNNLDWESDKLPTETGNYKIGVDIDQNDKWTPDPGKI